MIKYIGENKTENMYEKIYKGYNCTLKIRTLFFDNNSTDFIIEHDNPIFSPKIYPIQSSENFYFDFSEIMAGYENFGEMRNCLKDIEQFCEEFLRRKEEFEFKKDCHH